MTTSPGLGTFCSSSGSPPSQVTRSWSGQDSFSPCSPRKAMAEQTGTLPAHGGNRPSGRNRKGHWQSPPPEQDPSSVYSPLQVSPIDRNIGTLSRDTVTTPTYSPITPREDIRCSVERPVFGVVSAGSRSDPQPSQTCPTPVAWRNHSGPTRRYSTPASSPQYHTNSRHTPLEMSLGQPRNEPILRGVPPRGLPLVVEKSTDVKISK